MAKKTNSPADPATLAFSAVEDALKDSVFGDREGDDPSPARPARESGGQRSEQARARDKIAAQAGSVANDDIFQSSKILYGLQSRSSGTPTLLAGVASGLWVLAVIVIAIVNNGNLLLTPRFFGSSEFLSLIALAVIPVLGFFAVATLLRRAQDLRNSAAAVTQAAIRLAEPETTASEKVASVGQAVRREVNALGDGLERALSRAGELEVMIHNEVTALERTYSDNESRMRALIQELASQREAVITNTERVREAITESHTGLVFDLDMISQRIAGTIVESGGNLTKALETAGGSLNSAFGERTESFVSLIDNRTNHLLSALDDSASRLNVTLEDRASTVTVAFENRTNEASQIIDDKMIAMTEALDSRATTLAEAIDNRTSSLAKLLSQGGITLLDQLRDRGHEVSGALDMIGSRIAQDITGRAREAEALLGSLARQLDESVSIQVNAMESRIQSALIEVGGQLEEAVERARVSLSGAGAQTLSQFDARLDEIALVIDTRIQSLDGVVGDKGERLVAALDKHNAGFSARANVLEMALDEKSSHFNDVVGQRTREMTETIGQRAKQVTDAIANRSREISESLEGHAQIIADALDGRTQVLNDTLQARTTELSESLDARSNIFNDALEGRTQDLVSALEGRTQDLSTILQSRTGELSSAVQSRTQELAGVIQARTQELTSSVEGRTEAMSKVLVERTGQLDNALQTRTSELAEAVQTRTSELINSIQTRTEELATAVQERAEYLNNALDGHGQHIEKALDTRLSSIDSTLEQHSQQMIKALDTRSESLTTTLEGRSEVLNQILEQQAAQLSKTLDSRTQSLAQTVGIRSTELSEALSLRTSQLADTLGSHTVGISNAMGDRIAELARTIDAQGTAAREKIDESLQGVTDQMSLRTTQVSDLIASKVSEASENLGRGVESAIVRLADAESGVTQRIDAAASTVGESARKAADIIETGVNSARKAITDMVDQRLGTLPEAITARADITAERLSALNTAINTALVQSMADLEAGADRIEETIASRIVAASANIAIDVESHANRMDAAVRGALDQIQIASSTIDHLVSVRAVDAAEELAGKVETISRTITERTDVLANVVTESSDNLIGVVNQRTEALSSLVNEKTDTFASLVAERTDAFSNVVNEKADRFASLVAERTDSFSTLVTDQTDAYAALISERSDLLANSLQSHGNVLERALTDGAHEAESLMKASTGRIMSEVTGALEKLNESNKLLQTVLDAATTNLGQLETTVAERTHAYSDTVREALTRTEDAGNLMSERVDALQTSIKGMVIEFGEILGNLSIEAAGIEKVAENLNKVSEFSLQTLDERKTAMDGLATSFTARADDIDARMRGFAESIADTINDTERRLVTARKAMDEAIGATSASVTEVLTKTTGTVTEVLGTTLTQVNDALASTTSQVTQVLGSTTDEVTGRISEFRKSASAEGQKTSDSLRETQQAMLLEMQQALEEATRRFNDTAQAMRVTAKEVGGELEATRSELARGVMELPEETRASAAAMRRVVAEQIEALSELNAIVRAQPATHDLNDGRTPPRPQPPAREAEPAVRAAAEPVKPEPQARAKRSESSEPGETVVRKAAPVARQAPEKAPAPAAQPAAGKSDEGGGWLRDVLRNASASQPGAQPQGAPDLHETIANALDDTALGEAWARYQAGEQNVFSRRIYSLTGQATYDEVRKRLEADEEFRRSATSYMAEFERALKQAAEGDNPIEETREYLLSDRGKVYTMFAHASGRLR